MLPATAVPHPPPPPSRPTVRFAFTGCRPSDGALFGIGVQCHHVDVLAHRGLWHDGPGRTGPPENTVRSLLAAAELGADGVEVDLRVTGDGVVVLCHDPDLLRLAGAPLAVERTGWRLLREAAAAGGVALARLTDALPALARCRRVVLEVKRPSDGGLDRVAAVVAGELGVLLPALPPTRVAVSCFDAELLAGVRQAVGERSAPAAAGIRWALLSDGRPFADLAADVARLGAEEVHVAFRDLATAPVLPAPPSAVVAWGVDRAADARWCAAAGLSAVITDRPAAALMARRPRQLAGA